MRQFVVLSVLVAILVAGYVRVPAQTGADDRSGDRREQIQQCRAYLRLAVDFIDAGVYDSALYNLAEAAKCDPKNPDVFFHTARANLRLGDTAAAASALAVGVERAPLSSRVKLLLARLLIAGNNYNRADTLIESVLAIKPREGEALYLRGLTAIAQGDTVAAVADWKVALDIATGKK